jgi:uncharacterized OsmC-like protein
MKTAKVVYKGDLIAVSTHLASGQELITDAPVDNKGKGSAFSPTDLCATSLASCMITTLGIYSESHGFTLGSMEASVQKNMASDPRRIAGIDVDHTIGLSPEQMNDETLKTKIIRVAHTCPVARSLHPDLIQQINIYFQEETA